MRAEERTSSLWITLAEPPRNVLDIPKIRALQEALAPLSTRRERKVEEAYRLGLVTRVVEDLESETEASVQTLAGKSAVALSAARKAR